MLCFFSSERPATVTLQIFGFCVAAKACVSQVSQALPPHHRNQPEKLGFSSFYSFLGMQVSGNTVSFQFFQFFQFWGELSAVAAPKARQLPRNWKNWINWKLTVFPETSMPKKLDKLENLWFSCFSCRTEVMRPWGPLCRQLFKIGKLETHIASRN